MVDVSPQRIAARYIVLVAPVRTSARPLSGNAPRYASVTDAPPRPLPSTIVPLFVPLPITSLKSTEVAVPWLDPGGAISTSTVLAAQVPTRQLSDVATTALSVSSLPTSNRRSSAGL